MAAVRPFIKAAQNFSTLFSATVSLPNYCLSQSLLYGCRTLSWTASGCGHCSQQIAHSTSTTHHHACPGASLASPTHQLPSTAAAATGRPINRRTELDFDELRALQLAGDISLIDVRDMQELENYGGIPGSLHIPLCKIKTALQLPEEEWIREYNVEKPHHLDRNLIFYARGPNASSAAVEIAHRLGFKRSRHYTGGWEDYCRKTGQPLKKTQSNAFPDYYPNNFDQYFL